MSVQKIQANRALKVIPSDFCDVPYPNVAQEGTNTTAVAPNVLIDINATFITNNVAVGDIVYNTTSNLAATVEIVASETSLTLNDNIFLSVGDSYIIYHASPQTVIGNRGCTLYIGGFGSAEVTTTDGDVVVFEGLNTGQFVPVQVLKVGQSLTTATNIIALW